MAQLQGSTVRKAKWQPILNRYHYGQKKLKGIYEDMLTTFEKVVESKVLGDKITIKKIISDEEKKAIDKSLDVKPTIAFIGQVNAGKSSLANELLGGGMWLPVAPEPCTSRMVRLKYSKRAYKQQIPFEGDPKPTEPLKENRPTKEDIRLSDKEKKDPKIFEVELVFGVPNVSLYPDLEFVDLPGWSEKETINTAITEAVTRIAHPALLPVYVLNGNMTITSVDLQLLEILTDKLGDKRLSFVCNKIDHEDKDLKLNYGDGKKQVFNDGSAVYVVEDCKTNLLNKAEATFESLKQFGFVLDKETYQNASNFHAVSAKMSKASRQNEDVYQAAYYDKQFDSFTEHLNFKLERVLVDHILSTVRKANAVVARFAEGTLSARSAQLSSDVQMLKILHKVGEAEEKAYTDCLQFLSEEGQSIEDAVLDAYKVAKPKILTKAKRMTAKEFKNEDETVPAVAFVHAIGNTTGRILNEEITERIEEVKEKYVKGFSFFINVVLGSANAMLNDIFCSAFESDHPDLVSVIEKARESNSAFQSGLGLFHLIPDAVGMSLKETFTDSTVSASILTKITGASLGIVKLDEKWKESIAQEFLSTLDAKPLATRIVKNCRMKLDEKHQTYVQSHKQMIDLREARSGRSEDDILRLSREFTPKISLLLLRFHAVQCYFEKGEPERGEKIGEGRHSSTFVCSSWNGVDTQSSLVLKVSNPLSPLAWERTALSFCALRALQGNNEIYKYVVKVEGVLMSPLHVKKEQQLVRVVEKRAMTLQEALRSGLGIDEKKVIAFDVSRCLSFLHSKNTAFCNLVPNAVSLDIQKRAKLDVLKVELSYFEDSWLGCPAFHQAPEVFLDNYKVGSTSDVYSFGILLWEIFNESGQPPACYAECHTKDEMQKKVCEEGLRPAKADHIEDAWYSIMQDCWKSPEDRPSMEDLTSRIKDLVFPDQEEEGYSSDSDTAHRVSCRIA